MSKFNLICQTEASKALTNEGGENISDVNASVLDKAVASISPLKANDESFGNEHFGDFSDISSESDPETDDKLESDREAFEELMSVITTSNYEVIDRIDNNDVGSITNIAINLDVQREPTYDDINHEYYNENDKITTETKEEIDKIEKDLLQRSQEQSMMNEQQYAKDVKLFSQFSFLANQKINQLREQINEREKAVEAANEKRKSKTAQWESKSRELKVGRANMKMQKRKHLNKKRFLKKVFTTIQKNRMLFRK